MLIESVTGDCRVTPVVSGEESGEEEGDGELEESEEDDDDDDDDDGLLPVAGAPSRAAAPSGPVVEK